MMTHSEPLDSNFLLDLYLARPTAIAHPVLQILNFEVSEHNPKEIMYLLV